MFEGDIEAEGGSGEPVCQLDDVENFFWLHFVEVDGFEKGSEVGVNAEGAEGL